MPTGRGIVCRVPATDPTTMLAALAHPMRLRLLATIAEAGRSGRRIHELKMEELTEKQLRGHLKHLLDAGLIDADDAELVARLDRMQQQQDAERAGTVQGSEAAAYFKEGRLIELPRSDGMRRAVLEQIAGGFDAGRRYSEAEVNDVLRGFHDDYTGLRRHMVDLGLLDRDLRGTAYRVARQDVGA